MTRPHAVLLPLLALALLIGPGTAAAASDESVTSIYSLSDVVVPVRDFPGSLQFIRPQPPAPAHGPGSDRAQMEAFLQRSFEPGLAELILAHSSVHGMALTVTGSPVLHAHIAAVLAHVRATTFQQVWTRTQVVLMDPKQRQEHDALPELDWHDLPGCPGLAFARMTPAQDIDLEMRWSHEPGITRPPAPTLTAYSGQLASWVERTTDTYPTLDFRASGPSVGQGAQCCGYAVQVRATASEDRRFIHLEMSYDKASLVSLITVGLGTKPDGSANTVAQPLVATCHEQIDQEIEDGSSLLIATGLVLEQDQPPRAGFLIVTSTVLIPQPPPAHAQAMIMIPIPHDAQPTVVAPTPPPAHHSDF